MERPENKMESELKIDMQILRNTYAEHTLMPHFGGGEKASVETRGWATGWAAAESACTGATTAGGATNGGCETEDVFEGSGTLPLVDSTKSPDPTGKRFCGKPAFLSVTTVNL